MERFARAALCGKCEKLWREVYSVYSKAGFGEKMRVTSLSAGRVKDAGVHGKTEYFNQPARLGAVTFRSEDRRVLEEVLRSEITFPPLRAARQKKTGSL
jgi:hypothetical protein